MASWREDARARGLGWLIAGAMASGCAQGSGPGGADGGRAGGPGRDAGSPGGSVPAASAENAAPAGGLVRGNVPVPPGGTVSPAALEAAIRADAARQWGLADGASLRVTVEAVTWADGSLGCPQPGLMYTQALVPGWRLVVGDGRRELLYHASRRGRWVQCPPGLAARPLPGDAVR